MNTKEMEIEATNHKLEMLHLAISLEKSINKILTQYYKEEGSPVDVFVNQRGSYVEVSVMRVQS